MNTLDKERRIKGLNSQLSKLKGDIESKKLEISNAQKELNVKLKLANNIKEELESIKYNGEIRVTEHALLRYFERVLGFDLKEISNQMITEDLKSKIEVLGKTLEYPMGDVTAVVKNNAIVTIK
jgi:hypothetical protein